MFLLLQYVTTLGVLYFCCCSVSLLQQFYIFLLLQYVTAIAVLYISAPAVCHCYSSSINFIAAVRHCQIISIYSLCCSMSLLWQVYIHLLLHYVAALAFLYIFVNVIAVLYFCCCSTTLLGHFYIYLWLRYFTVIAVQYNLLLQYVTAIAVLYISVAAVLHCYSSSIFLLLYFTAIAVLNFCCCSWSLL